MKDIEVLISTMNKNSFEFLSSMNLMTDAIVINQNEKKKNIESFKLNQNRIKVINSKDKGLSNSRNLALKHASAEICVVADDDLVYTNDYAEKIKKAYQENPDADVIAFQVERIGNNNRGKTFRQKKSWQNYLTSMKISSVEITFKRESIINNKILFNPNFGAGTELMQGEENLFLFDVLKSGLKVLYVPIIIAEVDTSESSWFKGFNKEYLQSMGAKYYEMSPKLYLLLIIQYALRKHDLYKREYSKLNMIKWMCAGKREYKRKYK